MFYTTYSIVHNSTVEVQDTGQYPNLQASSVESVPGAVQAQYSTVYLKSTVLFAVHYSTVLQPCLS